MYFVTNPILCKAAFTLTFSQSSIPYHRTVAGTGSRLIRIKNDSAPEVGLTRAPDKKGTGSRLAKIPDDAAPVVGNGKQEEKVS